MKLGWQVAFSKARVSLLIYRSI